jgi:hypothetical protein
VRSAQGRTWGADPAALLKRGREDLVAAVQVDDRARHVETGPERGAERLRRREPGAGQTVLIDPDDADRAQPLLAHRGLGSGGGLALLVRIELVPGDEPLRGAGHAGLL